MTDILLVNLPKFEPNIIPSALAILKGIANNCKLNTKIVDFNLDWIDRCFNNKLDRNLILSNIHYIQGPQKKYKHYIDLIIKDWANQIVNDPPKMLAISIFSYYGQYFAKELSRLVKEKSPSVYIIIGGPGVSDALHEKPVFAHYMYNNKLIDKFVQGPAEESWLEILNDFFNLRLIKLNNTFLDSNYTTDYSDFEFERYRNNANRFTPYLKNTVIITYSASEGCVRKCDFCEIHRYWNFKQRTADQVKKNLQPLINAVADCHIEFTDSLVNGSLTEFEKILDFLIEIKAQHPNFTWSGQYIVRNHKNYPEIFYSKISRSGGCKLHIGVETGSDNLRQKMNKSFTNQDLDYTLKMFKKYGITCTILLFVGHPEETDKDFQDTIDMFTKYACYATNIIGSVQPNSAMTVHKNTPLYDKAAELGIKLTADPALWFCSTNPTLTFAERMRRRLILGEHLQKLNYKMAFDNFVTLDEYAINYSKYKHAIGIINRN